MGCEGYRVANRVEMRGVAEPLVRWRLKRNVKNTITIGGNACLSPSILRSHR